MASSDKIGGADSLTTLDSSGSDEDEVCEVPVGSAPIDFDIKMSAYVLEHSLGDA